MEGIRTLPTTWRKGDEKTKSAFSLSLSRKECDSRANTPSVFDESFYQLDPEDGDSGTQSESERCERKDDDRNRNHDLALADDPYSIRVEASTEESDETKEDLIGLGDGKQKVRHNSDIEKGKVVA